MQRIEVSALPRKTKKLCIAATLALYRILTKKKTAGIKTLAVFDELTAEILTGLYQFQIKDEIKAARIEATEAYR